MAASQSRRARAPLQVVLSGQPEAPACITRDIGEGGLFLFTERRWPLGSPVMLSIRHGSNVIPVIGRVERHEASGVAFSFVQPSNRVRGAIRGLLSRLFDTGYPGDDQRRRPRRAQGQPVAWTHAMRQSAGVLRDISADGARVAADERPPVGAQLTLYLPAGDEQPVPGALGSMARVVRHTADGFAVSIEAPSEAFLAAAGRLQPSRGSLTVEPGGGPPAQESRPKRRK